MLDIATRRSWRGACGPRPGPIGPARSARPWRISPRGTSRRLEPVQWSQGSIPRYGVQCGRLSGGVPGTMPSVGRPRVRKGL